MNSIDNITRMVTEAENNYTSLLSSPLGIPEVLRQELLKTLASCTKTIKENKEHSYNIFLIKLSSRIKILTNAISNNEEPAKPEEAPTAAADSSTESEETDTLPSSSKNPSTSWNPLGWIWKK